MAESSAAVGRPQAERPEPHATLRVDADGGVSLPLARVVFNPTVCLLGTILALVLRVFAAVMERLPAIRSADRLFGGWPDLPWLPGAVLSRPIVLGLPAILVASLGFALFGVAIARVAALRVCRGERLPARGAIGYAARNWISGLLYLPAIAIAAAGTLFIAGLLGLVGQIPFFGPILLVPIYPVAIALGVLVALIVTVGLLVAPTVAGALAVERAGTLDAISRSFSFAFSRPVPFLFYTALVSLLALAVAWLGSLAISAADLGLGFILRGDTLGSILAAARMESDLPAQNIAAAFAAVGLRVMRYLAETAVSGASIAVLFTGGVAVYVTMRREVDGIATSELEILHSNAPR